MPYIPYLHSKHSIPIIVTIHTIQNIHTVISNIPYPQTYIPYLPSIQYHTPSTPQGGEGDSTTPPTTPQGGGVPHPPHHRDRRGTVLWLTHDYGRGGRGVGTLDHMCIYINIYMYIYIYVCVNVCSYWYILPVVPHKAVAEVSKIGNL